MMVAMAACAHVQRPLKTLVDPAMTAPTKSARFAFYPEPDVRLEKREFYERVARYLTNAGYQLTEPERADYLIRLFVTKLETRWKEVSVPYPVARPLWETNPAEVRGDARFDFLVYPRTPPDAPPLPRVWEKRVTSTQREFRTHEEEFVLCIFAELGRRYDGYIDFPKKW